MLGGCHQRLLSQECACARRRSARPRVPARLPGAAGAVTGKETRQGLSRDSTWTRGQAWAIYGFTQAFQATRQPLFLQTAQRAADRFLARLPADGVPPWDFDAKPASVSSKSPGLEALYK